MDRIEYYEFYCPQMFCQNNNKKENIVPNHKYSTQNFKGYKFSKPFKS